MRSLKLTLAYDGTDFAGWQVQPGERTVQGVLEDALKTITGAEVRAVASGRTDAGVHALAQVVSVTTACRLPPDELRRALNGNLPRDVHVREVSEKHEGFHAIRDAVGKRYRYVIQDGEPDIFIRRYAWQLPYPLDAEAMHAASQSLLGTHDFSSFEASGSPRKTAVRTVTDIFAARRWEGVTGRIAIEVAADGFLYNMVRNIVGALFEVGRGARPPAWIAEILAARDRKVKYPTAPPQGLFLVEVQYEE